MILLDLIFILILLWAAYYIFYKRRKINFLGFVGICIISACLVFKLLIWLVSIGLLELLTYKII